MHIELKTAGDSHGPGIVLMLSGIPAGLKLDQAFISSELERRRSGPGRSGRQEREKDDVEFFGGIHDGFTTGAPIGALIKNDVRNDGEKSLKKMRVPRPGHADLPGALKYGFDDTTPVAERASARETVARVVAGAICKLLLKELDITLCTRVMAIGENSFLWDTNSPSNHDVLEFPDDFKPDETHIAWGGTETIDTLITMAEQRGYNLGAELQVIALNVPPGLGTHVEWDRRLDARITHAFISVPAIKGIDIGEKLASRMKSTDAQDEIERDEAYPWITSRKTNIAGGLEGGCTNGEPLVVTARLKPLPTSDTPLGSVDLKTGRGAQTSPVRHDVCPVVAVGVILESMMSIVLADAYLEKFGTDTMEDLQAARDHYLTRLGENSGNQSD